MIQTSSKFQELMKSNIRPRCEPIIEINGRTAGGETVNIKWSGKDIKNMTFRRKIDVLGREIPCMEMNWTEIYNGKLNEQAYPEKYNNVAKYMAAELSFVQYMPEKSTWKDVYNNYTWKTLFKSGLSWREVRQREKGEIVKLPRMFLAARPTVSGKTIAWKAVDLLSLLAQDMEKAFYTTNIPFENPIILAMLNARAAFVNSPDVFEAISQTVESLKGLNERKLDKKIIINMAIKDFIVKYCAVRNRYVDFVGNKFTIKKFTPSAPVFEWTGSTMYKFPNVTITPDISEYQFKSYVYTEQTENKYRGVSQGELIYQNYTVGLYRFWGYGRLADTDWGESEATFAASMWESSPTDIIPVEFRGYDEIISNHTEGEPFIENNPVFPYTVRDSYKVNNVSKSPARERFDFVKSYFNKECASLEFEGLPNVSIETGDIITVETNLYKNETERLIKNAVVVGLEITYNGGIREKITAHEVLL